MKKLSGLAAMTAFAIITCPANAKSDKQIDRLTAMTPEDFAAATSIKDDMMEPSATFDTQQGFQYKSGLLKMVPMDILLRAFVDKKTGQGAFQAYITVKYAENWLFIERANYLVDGNLKSKDVTKIASDVKCYTSTLCVHQETVGIDIDEAEVRWLAGTYVAGAMNPMPIRLKTKAGRDIDVKLMPAEAAGLLKRIDQYRAEHQLHPAV